MSISRAKGLRNYQKSIRRVNLSHERKWVKAETKRKTTNLMKNSKTNHDQASRKRYALVRSNKNSAFWYAVTLCVNCDRHNQYRLCT